ncbi:MAG: helix-turn-helix transcriptional regulator [Proteobacteria bacterium]|nr:helix-turn-helix transcriptional regulator [Pseudomonadota bacterium]
MQDSRSGCPISLTLEVLGDRWSLIVIRDIMFGNRRHFRELLGQSQERIASNVLADRLKRLVAVGLLSRRDDPTHRQKAVYSLTEPAIQLVPLLAQMGAWGRRHRPVTPELSIRAELLEQGGPVLWEAFMAELRSVHLGTPSPARSVLAELRAAYDAAVTGAEYNRTSSTTALTGVGRPVKTGPSPSAS